MVGEPVSLRDGREDGGTALRHPVRVQRRLARALEDRVTGSAGDKRHQVATRFKFSMNQRASPVMRASSCCWPRTCTPTGMPPTLISGTFTNGANSIDEGALNTKSPVGRGAMGWLGTSPDQRGAGPGQEGVIAASASDETRNCRSRAGLRHCESTAEPSQSHCRYWQRSL